LRTDEGCWQLLGARAYCHISKFRRRSAAFTNSDWQPDSYTHTNRNAISDRQPHAYGDTHARCHSAPAVWVAHFALTRPGRQLRLPSAFGYLWRPFLKSLDEPKKSKPVKVC
jgi:hypothetical protein